MAEQTTHEDMVKSIKKILSPLLNELAELSDDEQARLDRIEAIIDETPLNSPERAGLDAAKLAIAQPQIEERKKDIAKAVVSACGELDIDLPGKRGRKSSKSGRSATKDAVSFSDADVKKVLAAIPKTKPKTESTQVKRDDIATKTGLDPAVVSAVLQDKSVKEKINAAGPSRTRYYWLA